jgi:L-rhamnose mutarotase
MRTDRVLFVRNLDPDRIADYRRDHDAVWPELVALYRRCGVTEVSCFIGGSRLAVLFETDPEVFPKMRDALAADPVEKKWQALMKNYDVPGAQAETFSEVYRQSDH